MLDSQTNRKPADRLAEIRELIRVLENEEAQLRQEFIAGDHSLVGDEYRVFVTVGETERVDVRAIRRTLKPSALRPFLKTVRTTFVRVEHRHAET